MRLGSKQLHEYGLKKWPMVAFFEIHMVSVMWLRFFEVPFREMKQNSDHYLSS